MAAYWIRNNTTLLAMPQIDIADAQVTGSSVSASAMLSAAEPNISPAQMKPKR